MTSWQEFAALEPALAGAVRERFAAHTHHVMATLRADGAPRLCGTEVRFLDDRLVIAGMVGARRFADLRRDPRIALHTSSDDADAWTADARIAGVVAALLTPEDKAWFRGSAGAVPDGDFELFELDVAEAVHVGLDDAREALVVRSWTPIAGGKVKRR